MKYFSDYITTFPMKEFYKTQSTTLDFTFWGRKNLQSGNVPLLKTQETNFTLLLCPVLKDI